MAVLELRLLADAQAPGRARAEVKQWLAAQDWPMVEGEALVLSVSEAVSNAAEHAYRARTAEEPGKIVELVVTEQVGFDGARRAKATVTDFGRWRGASPNHGFRGRGLPMILTLMESCTVDHGMHGTRVTMISQPRERPPRRDSHGSRTSAGET